MGVGQRVGHVAQDPHDLVHREPLLPCQSAAQRFALDVGHHVVEQAVRLAGIDQHEDVGMLEFGGDPDLAQEAFVPQLRRQLGA